MPVHALDIAAVPRQHLLRLHPRKVPHLRAAYGQQADLLAIALNEGQLSATQDHRHALDDLVYWYRSCLPPQPWSNPRPYYRSQPPTRTVESSLPVAYFKSEGAKASMRTASRCAATDLTSSRLVFQ